MFINDLMDFVAVRTEGDRAAWEQAHPYRSEPLDNWECAMFAWRLTDPLSLHLQVRTFLDEWIDTGIRPDGSEIPSARAFSPHGSQSAVNALNKILDQMHRSPVRRTAIRPEGGIISHPRGLSSPTMLDLAAEIFYEFYCSEWVRLVMRCNRCKTIMIPGRKPRQRYERGWHCGRCRNIAGAAAAMATQRKRYRERWLTIAVDAYREYIDKPSLSNRNLNAFLTERVNQRLRIQDRIKRNTITLNLKEIQELSASHRSTRENGGE